MKYLVIILLLFSGCAQVPVAKTIINVDPTTNTATLISTGTTSKATLTDPNTGITATIEQDQVVIVDGWLENFVMGTVNFVKETISRTTAEVKAE